MTEEPHSTKLPQSWDTGSDPSGVPATVAQSPFGPLFLLLCVPHVKSCNAFDIRGKPSVSPLENIPTRDSPIALDGLSSPLGV